MPKAPQSKPDPSDDSSLPGLPPSPQREQGQRPMTFGEKAVGLTFNPSGDPTVHTLKELYAQIIDLCHERRQSLMAGSDAHRLWAVAITTAQDAQMWSVKAATWKD